MFFNTHQLNFPFAIVRPNFKRSRVPGERRWSWLLTGHPNSLCWEPFLADRELIVPSYHKNSNNRTMCYVVRNSLLQKRGDKHQYRNLPPEVKRKEKAPDYTKRGHSNVLAHIRLFEFLRYSKYTTIQYCTSYITLCKANQVNSNGGGSVRY